MPLQNLLANASHGRTEQSWEGPHSPAPEMILQDPPPMVSRSRSLSDNVDLHQMVAMVVHEIGSTNRSSDLVSWNDPSGIIVDHTTNERTFSILEAFAFICI